MSLNWLPNALCVLRILLVPPIVWLLLQDDFARALGLIAVAGFSDGLDGFLAKTFGWRTRLGGYLDPTADKLLMVSVFVTLTVIGQVPVWLAAVVLLRDVTIVAGASTYRALYGPFTAHPTVVSKLNTAVQLLFVLFVITQAGFGFPARSIIILLGAAVFVISVVSGMDYVWTWSRKAWRQAHP